MRKHNNAILLMLVLVMCAWAFPVMAAMSYLPTPEQKAHDEEVSRWAKKAKALLKQNALRGARQAADEALRVAGSPPQLLLAYELALIYMRSGQYKRAVALFGPRSGLGRNFSIDEAIALVKTHRLADARKCYRESSLLALHRDFKPYMPGSLNARQVEATLFLWHGIVDVDQNHSMNALWALKQALHVVPKNPLAVWYYAETLANAGHLQDARYFFQTAIQLEHGLVAQRAWESVDRLERSYPGLRNVL